MYSVQTSDFVKLQVWANGSLLTERNFAKSLTIEELKVREYRLHSIKYPPVPKNPLSKKGEALEHSSRGLNDTIIVK